MSRSGLKSFFRRHTPWWQRLAWVLFAIVFYQSGLAFTTLLLEGTQGAGWSDWLAAGAFPVLLPAFFWVNARLGCASGVCKTPAADRHNSSTRSGDAVQRYQPPPG